MTATVAVPTIVVAWARRHYRRTSRPYLFGARPGDVRFDVSRGSRGRYLLTLDLERATEIGLLDLAEGDAPEDRAAHAMLLLADAVAVTLGGEPIRFICGGQQVGRVEVIDSPFGTRAVRVRGHVALTCLSWLLRAGRAGYYLGEAPSATGRQLHGRSATNGSVLT